MHTKKRGGEKKRRGKEKKIGGIDNRFLFINFGGGKSWVTEKIYD